MKNATYKSKSKKNLKDKKNCAIANMIYQVLSRKFGLNFRKLNKNYTKLDNGKKIKDKKI
jgi:hypothetical protein